MKVTHAGLEVGPIVADVHAVSADATFENSSLGSTERSFTDGRAPDR
jgi:hypothetical protein